MTEEIRRLVILYAIALPCVVALTYGWRLATGTFDEPWWIAAGIGLLAFWPTRVVWRRLFGAAYPEVGPRG